MMSLSVLHAGDGYAYLTRSVATGDRNRGAQSLTDYYAATGTPPGRWTGAGLKDLADGPVALVAEQMVVAGEVTADQMFNLFGLGLHPNDEQIYRELLAQADTPRQIKNAATVRDRASKLGRKFPDYDDTIPLLAAVKMAVAEWEKTHSKAATPQVREQLTIELAPQFFADAKGREHQNPRELTAWIAREKSRQKYPVAGYDLTFTPQKSVSVLWALADKGTAARILDIHHRAINDALGWLEREAAFTRTDSGRVQLDVGGLIVAQFDHWDTRSGDPNLHTHCAVSNKVRRADGTWGSLDGASIFRHAVAASERYNAAMVSMITDELGVVFTPRETSVNSQPVMEIAGIDDDLIAVFSSRRTDIEARRDVLIADWRAKHGRSPSKETEYKLLQQATLDTREGKQSPVSLDQIRAQARIRARPLVPAEALDNFAGHTMLSTAVGVAVPDYVAMHMGEKTPPTPRLGRPAFPGTVAVAELVVSLVSERRATWTHAHIRARAEAVSTYFHFDDPAARRTAVEATVNAALGERSVSLAAFARAEHGLDLEAGTAVPAGLRRRDGQSVFTRHGEAIYTSATILAAEEQLRVAATEPTPYSAYSATITGVLEEMHEEKAQGLNVGQMEILRHFCQSGTRLAVATGPAGAGKTTAMSTVVRVWRKHGREVIALAPSAAAATVLGEEIGAQGRTLASLTYTWRGLHAHRGIPAKTLPKGMEIARGTMLLVDEAAMASTKDLAAIQEIADEYGAVVRLLGDPAQLDAVETGGALRMLADATHAPELTDVVRFGTDSVQANNSLRLRQGNTTGLALFSERGWLHAGTTDELLDEIFAGYLADTAAGKESLMIASSNTEVFALNARAQRHHHAARAQQTGRHLGADDPSEPGAGLADGHTAHVGDRVVTRANNRHLRTIAGTRPGSAVLNGDLWTIRDIHADGAMTVRHHEHGGTVFLPADYVKTSTQLGYASTIHRAQGMTVDVCRALIGPGTDRAGVYVALTRGRGENHAYVADTISLDADIEAHQLAAAPDHADALARLATVLARDEHTVAATTQMRDALSAATSDEATLHAYRYGQSLLRDGWIRHLLDNTLDPVTAARAQQRPESYAALIAGLGRAHDSGYRAPAVLEHIIGRGPLGSADDVAAVLGARLGELSRKPLRPVPALPPAYPGIDRTLHEWAKQLRPRAVAAARTAATAEGATRKSSVLPNTKWARMSAHELDVHASTAKSIAYPTVLDLYHAQQRRERLENNTHLAQARQGRFAQHVEDRVGQIHDIDWQIENAQREHDRLLDQPVVRRFRAAKIDPQVPVLAQRIAELTADRQALAAQMPAEREWDRITSVVPRGPVDDDQTAAAKDTAEFAEIDAEIARHTAILAPHQAVKDAVREEKDRRENLTPSQRAAENAERGTTAPPGRSRTTQTETVEPMMPPEHEATRDTGYGL